MSITSQHSSDNKTVTIVIKGQFDFNSHQAFRESCESAQGSDMKFIIDMGGTEYMDSSALGMLLLLREQAGNEASSIAIIRCRPDIKRILEVAHFHRLFHIE